MNPLYFSIEWTQVVFYLFCSVCLIQVAYHLFFFCRLAFHKVHQKESSQTHPLSVIICARDEAGNLAKYLPGVLVQDYSTSHEVVVVNDNSFDDTKYVLEAFRKSYKHLNVIELTQEAKLIPGKKFPLGVGIKSAKHEIVLLTDADCVPATEHWISSMQAVYDDQTEIVIGYSPFFKLKGFFNKLVRWECYHAALQYLSYALAGVPYMGVGRNLSYKKNIFFRNKGFSAHNNIPGGDDDLLVNAAANKKNTKINIDKNSFVLTKPAPDWNRWRRQKKRHYTTGKFYQKKHQFLLGLYSLSHFLFFPLFLAAMLTSLWKIVLIVFGVRLLFQTIVHYRVMHKLDEKDLFPFFILFDIWMFFYYILFAPSLFKKPEPHWK